MTDKQPGPNEARPLSSWKEIAAHLGVTVRTAQKWELERGLPVRRLPGVRGRVFSSAEELESWMRAPGKPVAPAVEPARSPWWAISLAGIVLLVVAAVGGGVYWATRAGVPSSWRVAGDSLIVVDERGREVWNKTFGFPLTDYQQFKALGQDMGWVGHLDGDGEPEVLFIAFPKPKGVGAVHCFSSRGVERWRFVPGASAARFPEDAQPPYEPLNLAVFRVGGAVRIGVVSVHFQWYASQVALLSGDGALLREYWHSGHIQQLSVADFAGTGKPLLYAGGIANGYHRAVLVVLDPERFFGASREDDPKYQLPGGQGGEEARVLFPRSCINEAKETYNYVKSIVATPSELTVGVSEETNGPATVMHTFGPDGSYRGAGLSSPFAARHTELEHTRLLDHRLEPSRETESLGKIRWIAGVQLFAGTRGAVKTE